MEKKFDNKQIIIGSIVILVIIVIIAGVIIFINSEMYREMNYKNNTSLSVVNDNAYNSRFYYNKNLKCTKEGNKYLFEKKEPNVVIISYNVAKTSETGTGMNMNKIISSIENAGFTFSGQMNVTISKIKPIKATRLKFKQNGVNNITYIVFNNYNTYWFSMLSESEEENQDFLTMLDSFICN